MKLKLIYYAFPRCDYSLLDDYLVKFKNELSTNIEHFSEFEIVNGNIKFANTYHFIGRLIELMNTEIDFDNLCKILRSVSKNEIQSIRDTNSQAYSFFEGKKIIDTNGISQSLTIKTLICVKKSGLKFKDRADIHPHGVSETKGMYAVIIKLYKNIVWHEVAHLFGADDHYIEKDVYKMKETCTNKESCVMQYDPGCKPCSFCSTAQKEIRNGMFKTTSPLSLNDFQ